jgi:hypothetical protein
MTVRLDGLRRGVAQPGRAPGSGPGGRRFKSSLPDHLFSSSYTPSKSRKKTAVGKNATVLTSLDMQVARAHCIFRRSINDDFRELSQILTQE